MQSTLKSSRAARATRPSSFTIRSVGWLSLLALVAAGCSDSGDDGNDGGGGSTIEAQYAAALDEMQTVPAPSTGSRIRVTITNRAPADGTFQTPVWMGFHDGGFDTFDLGAFASLYFPTDFALERLTEDGDADPIQDAFLAQGFGTTQGVVGGSLGPEAGPIAPGETVTIEFELDPNDPDNRYFSYASMVIPSNDAFVANDAPTAHEVFDAGGNFVATDFDVLGTAVLDAGTEVNDELAQNTAFFGQAGENSGIPEGSSVFAHVGFLAPGSGGILADSMFANADFTAPGYTMLSFRFEEVAPTAPATGVASIATTTNGSSVIVSLGAAGLSGPATLVHLHQGLPGASGPILVDLSSAIENGAGGVMTLDGTFVAPTQLAAALEAGEVYVDVHTALNPGGELRGDASAASTFSAELDTVQEVPTPVAGRDVRVTITNLAPSLGTFQTPVWVGFHNGTFDTHDVGSPASAYFPGTNALEPLAEDGSTYLLVGAFTLQDRGEVQGVLSGVLGSESGVVAPGETVSRVFRVDPADVKSEYFSYASMIVPSNDAFLAPSSPMAVPVYSGGTFVAADFTVLGSAALDAGTELNDENPTNTAFFGQMTDNAGIAEGGNVQAHVGYMAPGSGGILDDAMFTNADFRAPGYEFLRFRFDETMPGPAATGLVIARLNSAETDLEYQVFAQHLSGPATAMHLHNGIVGEAGPVLIHLTGSIEHNTGGILTASGSTPIDPGVLQSLRAGDVYLNVHTALNPAGEIRGQITLVD